jgi:hypothetical protein
MFQIKAYKADRKKTDYEFYVLCKGENSGRPSATPNTNSFVVIAENKEDRDHLYWLTYAIWKSNGFYSCLKGSVIPFITINDFKLRLRQQLSLVPADNVTRVIKVLNELDQLEANLCSQLQNILKLKKALTGSIGF